MDATYWGWNFGAVAIKDHLSGRVVWFKFIERKEKIEDYVEGVQWLENKRVEILGIVSDGLRGLRERPFRYKFQYCQFHQVKTVKHRLTSRPKLEASRELLDMVYFMSKTDKASFVGLFTEWEMKWKDFLKERSMGVDGKSHYIHKTLRSAYHSVNSNVLFFNTPHEGTGFADQALFSKKPKAIEKKQSASSIAALIPLALTAYVAGGIDGLRDVMISLAKDAVIGMTTSFAQDAQKALNQAYFVNLGVDNPSLWYLTQDADEDDPTYSGLISDAGSSASMYLGGTQLLNSFSKNN